MAVLGLKLTQGKVIRLWTCNIPTASHHCTSNQSVSVCRDTVLQAVSLIKGARFWVTSSCFPIFFITYPQENFDGNPFGDLSGRIVPTLYQTTKLRCFSFVALSCLTVVVPVVV